MTNCRLFALAALLSLAPGAIIDAGAQTAQSRYVKFDLAACETIDRDAESEAIIDICYSEDDYQIYLAEGDLRQFVGYGPNGMNQRAFSQTLAPFNRINNVLELRQYAGNSQPHAAILRYYTDSGMGDGSAKGEVLVVTKFNGEEACHMAYIDARANPNANELARNVADRDHVFSCYDDDPEIIGESGVSPM
ncbi:MAG: hypothetical protein KTR19_03495 [Hyphomicrobiales bacterium]|nr:hypothetical protein [Hyphomicrobiales bacterium]